MTSSHADTSKDPLPMNHPKNDAEFADKRNVQYRQRGCYRRTDA